MSKIQWEKTNTNILFKSCHFIVVILIVLVSFNVTWAEFGNPAYWDTFNLESYNVGYDPNGMARVAFDGQYVYFTPVRNNKEFHAEVVRYDALGEFTDPLSWKTFDYGQETGNSNIAGYTGVVFDGRYLYFSPWNNVYDPDGSTAHGNVLRYDTHGDFESLASWTHFNLEGHNSLLKGFSNIYFYDGYIYMPTQRGGASRIVRYDTTKTFNDWSSWEVLDVWDKRYDHTGMASDGNYIYFAPFWDGDWYYDKIHRYDITKPFTDSNSWEGFHATSINSNLKGFVGALYIPLPIVKTKNRVF